MNNLEENIASASEPKKEWETPLLIHLSVKQTENDPCEAKVATGSPDGLNCFNGFVATS